MIKLGSLFTGIGAWEKALKDMTIEYDYRFLGKLINMRIKVIVRYIMKQKIRISVI